jgi:hypothetical protein
VHNPRARLHRPRVVADVGEVDELRFAGEVDVIGAGRSARGDQWLAVLDVGPDSRDHHPRGGHDHAQRRGVGDIGVQQRQLGAGRVPVGEPSAQGRQLLAVAAGERPAEVRGGMAGQVLGSQRTSETGGTKQDDVIVAVCGR